MQSETQSGRSSWKSAQLPHLMREAISMPSETQSGRSSWKGAHIWPHAADRVLEPAHISRMELRLPVQMHDERGRLGVRLEHIEHSRREAMSSLGNQG